MLPDSGPHLDIQEFCLLQIPPWLVLGVPVWFLTCVQEQAHSQKIRCWGLPQFHWALWQSRHPGPLCRTHHPCCSLPFLWLHQAQQLLSVPVLRYQPVKAYLVIDVRLGDSGSLFVELHLVRGSQSSVIMTAVWQRLIAMPGFMYPRRPWDRCI